jgi:hypothetical protein
MKTARRDQMNKQNKQAISKKPRPEIRDDLDSRTGEEQQFKGDDITHNEKPQKNKQQNSKE